MGSTRKLFVLFRFNAGNVGFGTPASVIVVVVLMTGEKLACHVEDWNSLVNRIGYHPAIQFPRPMENAGIV